MSECYKVKMVSYNTAKVESCTGFLTALFAFENKCKLLDIQEEKDVVIDCVSYEDAVRVRDNIRRLGGDARVEKSTYTTMEDIQDVLHEVDSIETPKPKLLPKCPMCSSTNINKIGTGKKIVHGAAFGLFSKTARSQWECHNCGNKW